MLRVIRYVRTGVQTVILSILKKSFPSLSPLSRTYGRKRNYKFIRLCRAPDGREWNCNPGVLRRVPWREKTDSDWDCHRLP